MDKGSETFYYNQTMIDQTNKSTYNMNENVDYD